MDDIFDRLAALSVSQKGIMDQNQSCNQGEEYIPLPPQPTQPQMQQDCPLFLKGECPFGISG